MARLNHTTYAAGIPLTFIDGIDIPDLPDYGGINIAEAQFHGTESICCGDNFYGYVPNGEVEADYDAGLTPHYLPDLLFGQMSAKNTDTLDVYHQQLVTYIENH